MLVLENILILIEFLLENFILFEIKIWFFFFFFFKQISKKKSYVNIKMYINI